MSDAHLCIYIAELLLAFSRRPSLNHSAELYLSHMVSILCKALKIISNNPGKDHYLSMYCII